MCVPTGRGSRFGITLRQALLNKLRRGILAARSYATLIFKFSVAFTGFINGINRQLQLVECSDSVVLRGDRFYRFEGSMGAPTVGDKSSE